jgi:hypothetical protein
VRSSLTKRAALKWRGRTITHNFQLTTQAII